MKAREIYLHLAEACERAAATAPLPEKRSVVGICCCVAPARWPTSGRAKQRHQQQPKENSVGLARWTLSECPFVLRNRRGRQA